MPYESIKDLPNGVKDNLPVHAQEIYQSTYNNAYREYDGDEERAHRIAWAAVKNKYEKSDNGWHKKD